MVGDVILTLFPYTDLSNAKLRPAVVLAEVGMGDRVLCEITSSLQNRPEYIAITQHAYWKIAAGELGAFRPNFYIEPEPVHEHTRKIIRCQAGRNLGRRTFAILRPNSGPRGPVSPSPATSSPLLG